MADNDIPQIYLVTPPVLDIQTFPELLARALDTQDIACLRLALATQDEDQIARAADACREITHTRDIAIVIDRHVQLMERLGLDGVHLPEGGRAISQLRKDLGDDVIIGASCGASRHDGMNAGEAGADYVSFGPVGASNLGDGTTAQLDLFQWWSDMIEVPVVAEGNLTPELVTQLSDKTDFISLGSEVWESDAPIEALQALANARTR